jgi:fructosamine-3-kinase
MLPVELRKFVQDLLTERSGNQVLIETVSHVGGGSINQATVLKTTCGPYFLKYNSASLYPNMFVLEERGLQRLHDTGEVHVPQIISPGEIGEFSFLLLEYVDSAVPGKTFWEDFGSSLANMHKHTSDQFGLDHDNYIGSLKQSNNIHSSWASFFIEERLEPQVQMANLSPDVEKMFNKLYTRLDEIVPAEVPALLHGDLWSGNYMTSARGEPTLIDPAVYYGHREMDIGMTKLFGGFDERFYTSYNAVFPMESGWESRMDICNLYPLMVHVNLFGGAYLSQVNAILDKFTA